MKFFKTKITEGQFCLKDITYEITDTGLGACYQNMELVLFPEVEAETSDQSVEYEMRYLRLYHNNGFCTHAASFEELKGKRFVWTKPMNENGEEAGFLYVQEHEDVQEGTIEILDVQGGKLTVRWSGKANVGWSRKYGSNVPFETVFLADIPQNLSYCLDAFASAVMKIDETTQIEILNLEEFNREVSRVSESRQWEDFNTVLELKVTCADSDYLGTVTFTNGKNNYALQMDENCPRKIAFRGVEYNLRTRYEVFRFAVED